MSWRTLAIGTLVFAIALFAWDRWPRRVEEDVPAAALAPPPPRREPGSCLDATQRAEFVGLLRAYLDVDSVNQFRHHLDLRVKLRALHETGCDPLRDFDALVQMLYEARHFDAPFDRKTVGKEVDFNVDSVTGITSLQGETMRFSFQLPSKYPKDAKVLNAQPPYPMIVTLHDLEDFQDSKQVKKYPGAEVIKRRFPRASNKPIFEDFILFAPVATRAKFSADGAIDAGKLPLNAMWQRYHVDFDRTVIDGGSEALLFAAAQGVFYAGVIVRGDQADVSPAIVRNFAHLKVYVVGTEASAAKKSLVAGKMPAGNITVGTEVGIHAWIQGLERTTPNRFEWIVRDRSAQRFAHWINLNEVAPAVREPTMRVEVVATPDGPNTVSITSFGVRGVSLFLNDRILDLDRPVGIVVNGEAVKDVRLVTGRPDGKVVDLPTNLVRNADVAFDASPDLSVRRSRYYGFIYPVVLDFPVRTDTLADGSVVAAEDTPPQHTTPQQEAEAQQYLSKAEEVERAGDIGKAKRILQKAIDVGDTSVRARARAKLLELERR